jgi:uncharacterized protein YggT (Ycf19 family)
MQDISSTFVHFLTDFSFCLSSNPVEELDFTYYFFYCFSIIAYYFFYLCFILAKFYKFCCYTKVTIDWFPLINPYSWPFFIIRNLTFPYFKFWSRLLPPLKFKKNSIDISVIVGLEALNSLQYFCFLLSIFFLNLIMEVKKFI